MSRIQIDDLKDRSSGSSLKSPVVGKRLGQNSETFLVPFTIEVKGTLLGGLLRTKNRKRLPL